MAKLFITLASLSGMLAVIFGAFGAHALKSRLDDYALGVFETAVQYHFNHSLALLAVGILALSQPQTVLLKSSGWLFLLGIFIFFRQPLFTESYGSTLARGDHAIGWPGLNRRLGLPRCHRLETAGLSAARRGFL